MVIYLMSVQSNCFDGTIKHIKRYRYHNASKPSQYHS